MFYSLFTSEVVHDPSSLDLFFQSINLPLVSELFMKQLDESLSVEETRVDLYKMQELQDLMDLLLNFLRDLGTSCFPSCFFVKGQLPVTFRLLFMFYRKKDKDPHNCR